LSGGAGIPTSLDIFDRPGFLNIAVRLSKARADPEHRQLSDFVQQVRNSQRYSVPVHVPACSDRSQHCEITRVERYCSRGSWLFGNARPGAQLQK
jgi:hypothetical protein